jgi:hypothetical protein
VPRNLVENDTSLFSSSIAVPASDLKEIKFIFKQEFGSYFAVRLLTFSPIFEISTGYKVVIIVS